MKDLFLQLADPPNMAAWLSWVTASVAASALAAAGCVPAAQRFLYPPVRQSRFSDEILFEEVLADGETIRATDGSLIVTLSVGGRDLSSVADDTWREYFHRRKRWIDRIGALRGVSMIAVTMRRYQDAALDVGAYENPVLRRLQEAWSKGFSASFRNTHFLVLWVPGGTSAARQRLADAVRETREALRDFDPVVLKAGRPGEASALLGFWASLLNPGLPVSVAGGALPNVAAASPADGFEGIGKRLADRLVSCGVAFGDGSRETEERGVVRFQSGPKKTYMAGLGISKWGGETSEEILQRILTAPCEMIVAHWVDVVDRVRAEAYVVDKQKKDRTGRTGSGLEREEEFDASLTLITAQGDGGASLAWHETVAFLLAASPRELEQNVEDVKHAFGHFGTDCLRLGAEVQLAYYSLFPPHKERLQDCALFSPNVAHLVNFDTPEQGLETTDWGPGPVTRFPTMQASPYAFCFHRSPAPLDVGHTVVIGATGAGKTTLMAFLGLCSLGHEDVHAIFFDRSEGVYVPVTGCGGSYIHIASDAEELEGTAELNPFQAESGSDWTLRWLRDHVACDANAEKHLAVALAAMNELSRSERSMAELLKNLPIDMPGYDNLRRFATGQYRYLFNGRRDTFAAGRLVGIDFTRVLEDEVLVQALMPYLSHRIRSAMTAKGAPYLMMIDETQPIIRHPTMRTWFLREMQEARKERGVIVSCFQRVDALREEGVLSLLVGQSANVIAFPDPNAQYADYVEGLQFTPQAFDAIRGKHPLTEGRSRYMVVKRDAGEVILNVDLAPALGSGLLRLFGSGPGPAAHARALRKRYGETWALKLIEEERLSGAA